MHTSSQWISFFIAGLFSSAHCLVMCGAIVGALTMSLPLSVREQPRTLLGYLAAYNSGRILSYALAGFLAGSFGEMVVRSFGLDHGHSNVLLWISFLFLVGIGLYIAGWLPGVALLEKTGIGLWNRIDPLARSLLPVNSIARAVVFGILWGWFPCGLTYTVLIWSATTGNAIQGAVAMMAFGVGTLPGIFAAGFFSGRMFLFRRSLKLKRGLGILIILSAALIVFQNLGHETNAHPSHAKPVEMCIE
ncbi:MAG: sulfite exporter TauE/SafE family protein [Nitrospirae bacterium]|nr:sulfite exporter TauE/SafE family protein [Magnetococcales bacterium]